MTGRTPAVDRLLLILFLGAGALCASYAGWRDLSDVAQGGTAPSALPLGLLEGPARLWYVGLSALVVRSLARERTEPGLPVRRPGPELALVGLYVFWLGLVFTSQVRRLDFSRFALGYPWLVMHVRQDVVGPLASWLGWEGWAVARLNTFAVHLVTQIALPLLVFLMLGYRPRELGLRLKGWWLALPLAILAFLMRWLADGSPIPPARFLPAFLFNLGIGGLPEEFWARGLMQTRLERVLKGAWRGALVAAALYGLMHAPAYVRAYGSDWPRVLAACLGRQGLMGVAFGYLWLRTRSLAPGALWRAFADAIGSG